MARLKRKSEALENAFKRLSGVLSISQSLNLGNDLSAQAYSAKVTSVTTRLDAYNQLLSQTDAAMNNLKKEEKELRELSERMLEAIGAVYGHDSNEYEKAGGVRKSERKRPKPTSDSNTSS